LINEALKWAAGLADEGETLTAGVSLDQRSRSLVAELEQIVRPGTSTAAGLGAPSRAKTDFSGFLMPNAALSGVWTGEIARMPLHRLLTLFDAVAGQLAPGGKGAAAEFWKTVRDALLEEDVDGGAVVMIRPHGATLAVGGNVADGLELESQLRKLAGGGAAGMTWNLDTARFQDARLHSFSIPIPAELKNRRGLVRAFGESFEVAIAVGDRSLHVAAGRNPADFLKQVMRSSKSKTPGKQPPVQFAASLGPLVKLLADLEGGERTLLARLSEALAQSGGRDQVRLTARPVARGLAARLEMEESAVRALLSLWLPTPPGPRPLAR
jgi:hypothetical protein